MPQYIDAVPNATDTFLADFADLLPDLIQVAAVSTLNSYNEATFAPAVTYRGRVMRKTSARRRLTETEFVSPLHCILDCTVNIPLDSIVTLPDATTHIVRDSETLRDETNRVHHVTIYFAA